MRISDWSSDVCSSDLLKSAGSGTDESDVHPTEQTHRDGLTSLAPVISMSNAPAKLEADVTDGQVAVVPPPSGPAVELLQRRAGDRWAELPAEVGRATARAELTRAEVPIVSDPPTVQAADAQRHRFWRGKSGKIG